MSECVHEAGSIDENKNVCSPLFTKMKNEKKLYKLLAELVDTERTYVEDLEEVEQKNH